MKPYPLVDDLARPGLPVFGEVRKLAALEAAAGVLDVAITIALPVSAYQRETCSCATINPDPVARLAW